MRTYDVAVPVVSSNPGPRFSIDGIGGGANPAPTIEVYRGFKYKFDQDNYTNAYSNDYNAHSVSYTHLTLPTICSV